MTVTVVLLHAPSIIVITPQPPNKKKMKRIIPISLLSLSLLAACSDHGESQANALLTEANAAFAAGKLNNAKLLLDSIDSTFPEAVKVRREGRTLEYRIQLAEEERNFHMTDSLMEVIIPRINEAASKMFDFEKSEYEELGHYIYKGQQTDRNVLRSYIHAAVDEYGVTQLISTYCGPKIGHHALRIVSSDGTSITTQTIGDSDGANYQYQIDGSHYESVTYAGERDNEALSFICLHRDDKKLRAVLTGGSREVNVAISDKEREALAASYELGVMLRDRLRYEQENKTAAGKIAFIKSKLEKIGSQPAE